jgi:hypothetical protein
MRNPFRKFLRRKYRRARISALASIALAPILLTLLAQNAQGLASAWHDPMSLLTWSAQGVASVLRDPQDVLAERSPGTRDPNALYSIKPERIAALLGSSTPVPHERVLSLVRDRPGPVGLAALPPSDTLASLFPDTPLAFGAPGLTIPTLPAALLDDGDSPESSGGGPPSISPPGVPGVPRVEPPSSPPALVVEDVPSAVPEPSTWLMNIIGFFALAGALRHRGRATRNMAPGLA